MTTFGLYGARLSLAVWRHFTCYIFFVFTYYFVLSLKNKYTILYYTTVFLQQSCWWGPVLLWTAAGSARCPASVQSLHQTPPKLVLPPPLLLLSSRTCPQPSSHPLLVHPSTVASPSPSLWVLCQKLSLSRRTPEPYCPVPPVSSPPSVSGRTSRLLFLSPSWTLAVLPRSHLLLFSWSLRLKPSPTVSVLGWVEWCRNKLFLNLNLIIIFNMGDSLRQIFNHKFSE